MPRADQIIAAIKENEGFNVAIIAMGNSKPVNANRNIEGAEYAIRTRDEVNVSQWAAQFSKLYPGFYVQVLKPNGEYQNGKTLLRRVRGEQSQ